MEDNAPSPAASQDLECQTCYVALEAADERFYLQDERRPWDEAVDRTPYLYCEDCVRLLFRVAFDGGKADAPLGHLQIDDYARLFEAEPGFIAAYKAKEDRDAIYPLWTRIICSECEEFVGQYRRPLNRKCKQQKCLKAECGRMVCMACGQASPGDDHVCPDRVFPNDEVHELGDAIPSRHFQQCPNCHLEVWHGGACNAMDPTCGASFCFICGLEAREGSGHWSQLRGVCPKYNHPTPLYDREQDTGAFRLPLWQEPFHPLMGPNGRLWSDPTRPYPNTPARNLDGNVSRHTLAPGEWAEEPDDRPVLHVAVDDNDFEALQEGDSEWRAAAEALERQFQALGTDGVAGQFIEPSHLVFMRQLLLSGRNACRMLHNGFNRDVLGDEEGQLMRRLHFAHLAGIFRQYLVHFKTFPPNNLTPEETDVKWRDQYPTFTQLYRDLLPIELGAQASATGRQSREDHQTFRVILQHLVSDSPAPAVHVGQMTLSAEDDVDEFITQLAQILCKIFELIPVPDVLSEELAGPEKVVTGLESVDRVRLRHYYEQAKELVESPRFTAAQRHRLPDRMLDQDTILRIAIMSVNQVFETENLHPQETEEEKHHAAFLADLGWVHDVLKTLEPFRIKHEGSNIAMPGNIDVVYDATTKLYALMKDPTAEQAEEHKADLNDTIWDAVQTGTINPPVLRSILVHAGRITQGLFKMREGIFGDGHDSEDPEIMCSRAHLRWAGRTKERLDRRDDLSTQMRRVLRAVTVMLPVLEWIQRRLEGLPDLIPPDQGDYRYLVLQVAFCGVPGLQGRDAIDAHNMKATLDYVLWMMRQYHNELQINLDIPPPNNAKWTDDSEWLESISRSQGDAASDAEEMDPVVHDSSASMLYLLTRLRGEPSVRPDGEIADRETGRAIDKEHLDRLGQLRFRLIDDALNTGSEYYSYQTSSTHAPRFRRMLDEVMAAAAESDDINPVYGFVEPANCQHIRDELRAVEATHRHSNRDPTTYLDALRGVVQGQQWPRAPFEDNSKREFVQFLGNLREYIRVRQVPRQERDGPDDYMTMETRARDVEDFFWSTDIYPLGEISKLLPRLNAIRKAVLEAEDVGDGGTPMILSLGDLPLIEGEQL